MKKKIYALYKGETNICDGTIEEIAKRVGKTRNILYCYKSPSKVKKNKGNRYELVYIGEEHGLNN